MTGKNLYGVNCLIEAKFEFYRINIDWLKNHDLIWCYFQQIIFTKHQMTCVLSNSSSLSISNPLFIELRFRLNHDWPSNSIFPMYVYLNENWNDNVFKVVSYKIILLFPYSTPLIIKPRSPSSITSLKMG